MWLSFHSYSRKSINFIRNRFLLSGLYPTRNFRTHSKCQAWFNLYTFINKRKTWHLNVYFIWNSLDNLCNVNTLMFVLKMQSPPPLYTEPGICHEIIFNLHHTDLQGNKIIHESPKKSKKNKKNNNFIIYQTSTWNHIWLIE